MKKKKASPKERYCFPSEICTKTSKDDGHQKQLGDVDYKELPIQKRIQIDQKITAKKQKVIQKITKKILRKLKKQEKVRESNKQDFAQGRIRYENIFRSKR